MKIIDIIQQFEKDFIAAGKLAVKLRKNAVVANKFSSGFKDIDIVTSSDLTVQEFVLKKLAQSDLKKCELVAEEKTSYKELFAKKSDLVLTLDPIDGTMMYANGGRYYSIIVTLHDKKRPIYTFDYFPEINWGVKIVNDKIEYIGKRPDISRMAVPPKTIAYASYDGKNYPKKTIPEIYNELTRKGYVFKTKEELGDGLGSTSSFLLGLSDGFYYEDGSAVDCLAGLHFGLASKYKIIRTIDISETKNCDLVGGTAEYKGYYLVLKDGE